MQTQKVDIETWEQNARGVISRDRFIRAYSEYISTLQAQDLPPVFELQHLSGLIGVDYEYVLSAINSPTSHYREFKLPKRKGGFRLISVPYPGLLACQRWIHREIVGKVPVSAAAHGFVKGRSILTNAQAHLGQECLLRLDIKDFFPSISLRRVIS